MIRRILLSVLLISFSLSFFAQDLRIGTLNLDGYPSKKTNDVKVWEAIVKMNVDILVVQGVSNTAYLKTMVEKRSKSSYTVALYPGQNTWQEKICYIYNTETVDILSKVNAFIATQLDAKGKFHIGWKPAHHVYVKAKAGFDFHLIGVHMAGEDGDETSRKKQWESIYNVINNSLPEDMDIVVLGDFNCYEGYHVFDTLTKSKQFYHVTPDMATNCRNEKLSYTDNILVSKSIYDEEFKERKVEIAGPVQRITGCGEFTSSEYYTKVSSHLPLVISLAATDNDPRLLNEKVTLNHEAVIGNKYSKYYYHPEAGVLPAKSARVYFSSRLEAERSGYRPSKNWDWQGKVKKK